MKTRPVWLKLAEGGVKRVEMRSQRWTGAMRADGEGGVSLGYKKPLEYLIC